MHYNWKNYAIEENGEFSDKFHLTLKYVSCCDCIILMVGQLTLRIHRHSNDDSNSDDNDSNNDNITYLALF